MWREKIREEILIRKREVQFSAGYQSILSNSDYSLVPPAMRKINAFKQATTANLPLSIYHSQLCPHWKEQTYKKRNWCSVPT
jgi:hypothetical protein